VWRKLLLLVLLLIVRPLLLLVVRLVVAVALALALTLEVAVAVALTEHGACVRVFAFAFARSVCICVARGFVKETRTKYCRTDKGCHQHRRSSGVQFQGRLEEGIPTRACQQTLLQCTSFRACVLPRAPLSLSKGQG
jgi:hypothetical protein